MKREKIYPDWISLAVLGLFPTPEYDMDLRAPAGDLADPAILS